MKADTGFRLYPSLFLSSAATLGFEVLLTRIFSVALWQHFGHMVVSIAMLGVGLSGTLYAFRAGRRGPSDAPRPELFLLLSASMVVSYLLAVRIPFDPLRLSWDRTQLLLIGLYYVTLSLPFLVSGLVLVSAFSAPGARSGFVYGSDLLGAATGCLVVFALLWRFVPGEAVLLFALLPLAGAWLLGSPILRTGTFLSGILLLGLLLASPPWLRIPLSPYKELPTLLQFQSARLFRTLHTPYGRLDLFESPGVRYAPGLSLSYQGRIPAQLGLSVDGGSVTAVTPALDRTQLDFLQYIPAAAPYALRDRPEVFILNPGGGLSVLLAQRYGAARVDAVEQNPALSIFLSDTRTLQGPLYAPGSAPGFGRNTLRSRKGLYDIVDIALTAGVSSEGSRTGESYGYTVQAFGAYLESLKPDGLLAVSTFVVPPLRTEFRLVNTLLTALEATGIAKPEQHVVAIRSLEVLVLLTRKTAWKPGEIAVLRQFARDRWFDLVYYPGIREDETRRFIRTEGKDLTTGVLELMNPARRAIFAEDYVFDISPTTDEQPFFFEHLRFSRIRETWDLVQKKWDFFIREGYLTPAILVQILLAGTALVLLPAFVASRRRPRRSAGPPLFFFGCLGFGYMAVEIPLIQKLVLPLEHPVVAFAVAVGILLVASGSGSLLTQKREPSRIIETIPLVLGLLMIPAYVLLLPWFSGLLAGVHGSLKVPLLCVFLLPLGILMGMPFPAGIAITAKEFPDLVPWAWGINGFLSVLTPVLSVIIAWRTGLGMVMLLGGAAYLLAYFASRGFVTSPVMGTKTTGVD